MKWRKQWDDIGNADAEAETLLIITDPGMTLQAPAEEADINVIIKRFGITDGSAPLPYWSSQAGLYGDISEFPQDPTEIANIMRDAELRFMALPGDVRQRFTTPQDLFEFLGDEKNADEARKLGLLKPIEPKPPEPEPMRVRVVPEPEAPK